MKIRETIGMGIINPRAMKTPLQRLYVNVLKHKHIVVDKYFDGEAVVVLTRLSSNKDDLFEYKLSPRYGNVEEEKSRAEEAEEAAKADRCAGALR